jgi:hypothetical protein
MTGDEGGQMGAARDALMTRHPLSLLADRVEVLEVHETVCAARDDEDEEAS